MNAIQFLKKDHRKVEEIFKKLTDTTSKAEKTREDLFMDLDRELLIHAHVEETVFYPAIKEKMKELTLEAVQEHHVVKTLLRELSKIHVDTDEWFAKLTVLKENVKHHVKGEEDSMFPKAEKALGANMISLLGKNLEEEKKNIS